MIGQNRGVRRVPTRSSRRPWIGIRGGVAAAVVFAMLVSADARGRAVLLLADGWSLLSPPRLSASVERPPTDATKMSDADRRLVAECLRLRRILRTAMPPLSPPEPVVSVRGIPATVLWTDSRGRDAVLALPEEEAVTGGELVLDDDTPHLSAGATRGVSADAIALAGRCVLGRVAKVGSRSSTITSVTSDAFEVEAELVRGGAEDPVVGAGGTYRGDGVDGGVLTMIPVEEPVNVGDEVFTRPGSTWSPDRLSVGVVTAVESEPGEPHWTVRVTPHADLRRHDVVRVLTARRAGDGPR